MMICEINPASLSLRHLIIVSAQAPEYSIYPRLHSCVVLLDGVGGWVGR